MPDKQTQSEHLQIQVEVAASASDSGSGDSEILAESPAYGLKILKVRCDKKNLARMTAFEGLLTGSSGCVVGKFGIGAL